MRGRASQLPPCLIIGSRLNHSTVVRRRRVVLRRVYRKGLHKGPIKPPPWPDRRQPEIRPTLFRVKRKCVVHKSS